MTLTIAGISAHSNVLDCNHNYFGSMLVYYVVVYYSVAAMAVDRLLFLKLKRYCVVYYELCSCRICSCKQQLQCQRNNYFQQHDISLGIMVIDHRRYYNPGPRQSIYVAIYFTFCIPRACKSHSDHRYNCTFAM